MIWLSLLSSFISLSNSLEVKFDSRSFLLNNQRELFIGGCIHYPRSHYSEWSHIFQEAKEQGINLIETYVFWDIHEQTEGEYYFPSYPSSANLIQFINEAKKHNLYVHLRFGPYVCAEWNYGGLPVWLRDIGNGTSIFRTTDKYWMNAMTSFIDKVIEVVDDAKLFAKDDGPIIMVQIENEYGNIESSYGEEGANYIAQVSEYALNKHLDVPWVMCQQGEGVGTAPPAEIINACNGHYCDNWISQHTKDFPNQPHMWTENWPGWFQKWGEPVPHRPATDVAFSVARWFARGGSFLSYYMAFGGSNFGRSVGGPQIVTSYDYDVQINEYGLRNEPKYSLLQQLHEIIHSNKDTILDQMPPNPISFGSSCEVHSYSNNIDNCLVFLSNWNTQNDCVINYHSDNLVINSQTVSPWSVTIMKGTGNDSCLNLEAIYNTKTSVSSAEPENKLVGVPLNDVIFETNSIHKENIPSINVPTIQSTYPLEQLSVTKDTTDYLWYSTQIESNTTSGKLSYVTGGAGGDVIYVFVNQELQTSSIEQTKYHQHLLEDTHLKSSTLNFEIEVPVGKSQLDILSVSMGLNNYGAYLEQNQVGAISNMTFNNKILTKFTHSIGLTGEVSLKEKVNKFSLTKESCTNLCWYNLQFSSPKSYIPNVEGLSTIALDIGESKLSKGIIYVNGQMIGRYWSIIASKDISGVDCEVCDELTYSGSYSGGKCRRGCGSMSQRYYKIPYQFLYPVSSGKKNELIIFDEYNGSPDGIQLVEMKMESI